jgi:drug/metabolite transporter (DMT)-like permease
LVVHALWNAVTACDLLTIVFIQVAVIYFHDKFTWLKGAGLLIIMVGVGLFNWYK